ncbi:OmpW/AlkL family protein [Sphingomonas glacialis]|nr:OmpW family protein [Sphingomonas glacialis]
MATAAGGVQGASTLPSEAGPHRIKDDFYLHVGPGAVLFDANAVVRSQGTTIPGATVSIDPNVTLITEIGYRRRNLGLSITGGFPPRATVDGAGTLTPYGALGRIRYGTVMATAHYHFTQFGRLQPYVGGGAVLLLIFKNEDLAVHELRVDNHVGGVLQAGADFKLSRHMSLFLDAKKVILKTNATAVLGDTPISANIRLNPVVLTGGLSYHF